MGAPTPARTHPWTLFFGPWSVGVGATIVFGALVGAWWIAPESLGVDLCWFHRVTALPCPGCGLTRSVVALARGDWRTSVAFHPFGPLVLAWALVAIASVLLRGARRERAVEAFGRLRVDRWYGAAVLAFVGFGVARLVLAMWGSATGA